MRRTFLGGVLLLIGCTFHQHASQLRMDTQSPEASQKHVQALLSRLHENPDPAHGDYTDSVYQLMSIGEPAIEPTLPYLLSEDRSTRVYADRAITGAIRTTLGFRSGDDLGEEGRRAFEELYPSLWNRDEMGGVGPDEAPVEARQAYIERIRWWLADRRGSSNSVN